MSEIVIAFACALLLSLLLVGCGARRERGVRTLDGNLVDVESVPPELRGAALRAVEKVVRGRLPGVKFYVRPFPVQLPGGAGIATSYRAFGPSAFAVFSWRMDPIRGFVVEDIPWEVEHLIAGTDDAGRRVR